MTSTWFVVLNWFGKDDTLELLAGLHQEPATIVVVDNGSYDGTLEAVNQLYPGAHTVQTGANLGYAGGNNVGITYALDRGAEVICVLNNDTTIEAGFLGPLLTDIATHPRSAVSPEIGHSTNAERPWWRGSYVDTRTGWIKHTQPEDMAPGRASFATESLSGCCIMAPAEVWRAVGLFDEGLFLIFEDSDWCRRALALGVELRAVPESRILHKISRSFNGEASDTATYYFARNGYIFVLRHFGWAAAARFALHHALRGNLREPDQRRLALRGLRDGVRGRGGPFIA